MKKLLIVCMAFLILTSCKQRKDNDSSVKMVMNEQLGFSYPLFKITKEESYSINNKSVIATEHWNTYIRSIQNLFWRWTQSYISAHGEFSQEQRAFAQQNKTNFLDKDHFHLMKNIEFYFTQGDLVRSIVAYVAHHTPDLEDTFFCRKVSHMNVKNGEKTKQLRTELELYQNFILLVYAESINNDSVLSSKVATYLSHYPSILLYLKNLVKGHRTQISNNQFQLLIRLKNQPEAIGKYISEEKIHKHLINDKHMYKYLQGRTCEQKIQDYAKMRQELLAIIPENWTFKGKVNYHRLTLPKDYQKVSDHDQIQNFASSDKLPELLRALVAIPKLLMNMGFEVEERWGTEDSFVIKGQENSYANIEVSARVSNQSADASISSSSKDSTADTKLIKKKRVLLKGKAYLIALGQYNNETKNLIEGELEEITELIRTIETSLGDLDPDMEFSAVWNKLEEIQKSYLIIDGKERLLAPTLSSW